MAAGFCSKTVKPTKTNRRLKRMTAPNRRLPNKRYDVFKDISNLELYKKKHDIDLCCFILATDHLHDYNQEHYSADTTDFDIRNRKEYKATTVLRYKTDKPYGQDISLNPDYKFLWNKINNLYFLN